LLEKIVVEASRAKKLDDLAFNRIKRKHMRALGIHGLPGNVKLFSVYQKLLESGKIPFTASLDRIIKKRKMRTLSGIASITILTKDWGCPGKCTFCPTEKGMPKSYLSNEPAVMRAVLNQFDPYRQVRTRLESLAAQGHATDKIEVIVIGGTWSAIPKDYQEWYIKKIYEALNDTTTLPQVYTSYKTKKTLKALQMYNEKYAKHKLVGLTLETRPDWVTEKDVKLMRAYGCTRVELGVQSVYDDVLDASNRGHHIDATIRATKLLKDNGFKINYHMMPNLPGSTIKKDISMFKEIFENPSYRPDMMKIYPCMVVKDAKLYDIWKKGGYTPYTDRQLIEIAKKAKSYVPEYCRIVRVIRDIPATSIEGGSKASNLRQTIQEEMKKEGLACRCIRCREIKDMKPETRNMKLKRMDYEASDGHEIFLTFDDVKNDKLVALLRLRIPAPCLEVQLPNMVSALKNTALIREIHTYGEVVPLMFGSSTSKHAKQHKGLGKKLLKEAERIAKKEFGAKKMAVIAGAGVRGYYRAQDYSLKDTYMVKAL